MNLKPVYMAARKPTTKATQEEPLDWVMLEVTEVKPTTPLRRASK
jgi:hypothetical protein